MQPKQLSGGLGVDYKLVLKKYARKLGKRRYQWLSRSERRSALVDYILDRGEKRGR